MGQPMYNMRLAPFLLYCKGLYGNVPEEEILLSFNNKDWERKNKRHKT